ncbi:MAG: VIT1/CCC1 transporter family protein [Candidatus Izemoplasmatales bacterium]|jgi:VIT1/CCC1 family predicted Fe2+/Mn2+ transporter|nr:VIT1/CCC1 transporter family protein [Candidatus Izemoplasmatales bacterium]
MALDKNELKIIKAFQKGEITEYYVYRNIAKKEKDEKNKEILLTIAKDEMRHYKIWENISDIKVKESKLLIFIYKIMTLIFGYTFTLRVMEMGEEKAQKAYLRLKGYEDVIDQITKEEEEHEQKLLDMLDEERLNYVGSMVLGLNDALVELSGTLAGLTFAFQNTTLISLSGLITGIAASLSMAASEYLSSKADNQPNALKSSVYTGSAYIVTVILLVLPYLLIHNPFVALGIMIGTVIFIIFFFNLYISVAKNIGFKKRFLQMAAISLGVAGLSFVIGIGIDRLLGVTI